MTIHCWGPGKVLRPFGKQHDTCGKIEMSIPMASETHFWELGLWK